MTTKRSRFRVYGRWGMYVLMALLLLAIPLSVFVQPELIIRHGFNGGATDVLVIRGIGLEDGRITFESSRYSSSNYLDFYLANAGWSFDVYADLNLSSLDDVVGGLIVPWAYSVSPSGRWEVSLMYPIFVIAGCLWLLAVDRKHKACRMAGRCSICGYLLEGLDGGVCPECGDGAADEE